MIAWEFITGLIWLLTGVYVVGLAMRLNAITGKTIANDYTQLRAVA